MLVVAQLLSAASSSLTPSQLLLLKLLVLPAGAYGSLLAVSGASGM